MAEWYPLTQSKDGTPRLDFKVEYRMSLADLSVVLASQYAHDGPPDGDWTLDWAKSCWRTRQAVLSDVKKALEERTFEGHSYNVGDGDLNQVQEIILERLNLLW